MKKRAKVYVTNVCPICAVIAGTGECVWCVDLRKAKQSKPVRRNKERPKPSKEKRSLINPRNNTGWR